MTSAPTPPGADNAPSADPHGLDDPTLGDGLFGRGWLRAGILGAVALSACAGYAAFATTAVLGDVAEAFGAAESAGRVAREVGLSATTLGVGLAIVRFAGIGAVPAASLADRYGRRRLLLWLAAVGLGLTTVAAASPGYWAFIAFVAAARPLLAGANTITVTVAAEMTTAGDRSKAVALAGAAYAAGAGLVTGVRGLPGGLGFRWVLALSALLLLVVPVAARYITEPAVFARQATTTFRRLGAVDADLRPRLLLAAGLAGAHNIVTGPAFTFLFLYGENVLGASPAFMTGVVAGAGATGFLGLLAGRWAADHRGRRITAGAAMVITAAGGLIMYSGALPALVVGYLLTVFAAAAFGPAGGALLAEIFPTRGRATATGWTIAVGVAGGVVGLAVFGALTDVFASFATAAAVLFLPVAPLAGLYAFLPETRGLELDQAPGTRT